MAKLFTITEGLQNLGALKTGGQGSVYKTKRVGEIITAVKLLPTPIFNESPDDKHFLAFNNEVQKLKKVNEQPNPNVVKIISSGITETGSLPFIEMEYIEGPDLEELLKPPHEPVFTIKEVIRVADHLSNALSHCHKLEVKHGDIKSNNVKYNLHSGNYVLLDFGLAVMSDEQRRTSLRQAGAIEFMAPEQGEGKMLFETDVYSFGVILFELLAGQVPFPLRDKSETARNQVLLAHMETSPPDVIALRREHLPAAWDQEKKDLEMNVPEWIIRTIYKCLEKSPASRFPNGVVLHHHIIRNSIAPGSIISSAEVLRLQQEIDQLRREKKELQAKITEQQKIPPVVTPVQTFQKKKETVLVHERPHRRSTSGGSTILAFFLTLVVLGSIVFFALKENDSLPLQANNSTVNTPVNTEPAKPAPKEYRVATTKTFFHNQPDPATARKAFLPSGESITATDESNGYVYTEYTNSRGQVSKGWIRRQDLVTPQEWLSLNQPTESPNPAQDEIPAQLRKAAGHLSRNEISEAIKIYGPLADLQVPEAMYHYANTALQKKHAEMECAEAIKMMEAAADKGWAPARRTLGFLYIFAENRKMLVTGNYDGCYYEKNVPRGTQLLIQAIRDGDTTARNIMEQVNAGQEGTGE